MRIRFPIADTLSPAIVIPALRSLSLSKGRDRLTRFFSQILHPFAKTLPIADTFPLAFLTCNPYNQTPNSYWILPPSASG